MTTATANASVALGLHNGLIEGGVDHCLYVPDSVMGSLTARCEKDPNIATVVCAREDRSRHRHRGRLFHRQPTVGRRDGGFRDRV